MNNLAESADGIVGEHDCTLMNHFRDQVQKKLTKKGTTNCITFGYFYNRSEIIGHYYCAYYGASTGCGVKPGYDNDDKDRRLICPCYQT